MGEFCLKKTSNKRKYINSVFTKTIFMYDHTTKAHCNYIMKNCTCLWQSLLPQLSQESQN